MELLTTYNAQASKIRKEDDKALLIWIANGRPYFHKHYWFRGLAPKWECVKAWKDEKIIWEQFEDAYRFHLKTDHIAQHQLEQMESILTNENAWYDKVYLVCYEKSDEFCHRRILKEVLDGKIATVSSD